MDISLNEETLTQYGLFLTWLVLPFSCVAFLFEASPGSVQGLLVVELEGLYGILCWALNPSWPHVFPKYPTHCTVSSVSMFLSGATLSSDQGLFLGLLLPVGLGEPEIEA